VAVVREAVWSTDTRAVSDLIHAYLVQTEGEKRERQHADPGASESLPERYRHEAHDPQDAYTDSTVLVAEVDRRAAGVVAVRVLEGQVEIKRLWADPDLRGLGVGSALLDAALALAPGLPVRLSVWEWRASAIRLYESRGFRSAPSWEDRPGLVCMVRDDGTR